MDQATKDQSQVRGLKKRGRPPKVQVIPCEQRIEVEIIPAKDFRDNSEAIARAQALAQRIWDGQSPDTISRAIRLGYVKAGLEAQGLSMEGVVL
jgi:hypothetical protein